MPTANPQLAAYNGIPSPYPRHPNRPEYRIAPEFASVEGVAMVQQARIPSPQQASMMAPNPNLGLPQGAPNHLPQGGAIPVPPPGYLPPAQVVPKSSPGQYPSTASSAPRPIPVSSYERGQPQAYVLRPVP
jgi:hypothetical protein